MELRLLTEDELFAHIESLDDAGEPVHQALEELFRRLREQATPEDRGDLERVIRFVRSAFGDDEGDGSDDVGVREPRRPAPKSGSAGAARRIGDAA